MVTSSIWHTYCRISFQVGAWRYTTEIMLASIIFNVTCVWTTARICQQRLIIIYETYPMRMSCLICMTLWLKFFFDRTLQTVSLYHTEPSVTTVHCMDQKYKKVYLNLNLPVRHNMGVE